MNLDSVILSSVIPSSVILLQAKADVGVHRSHQGRHNPVPIRPVKRFSVAKAEGVPLVCLKALPTITCSWAVPHRGLPNGLSIDG